MYGAAATAPALAAFFLAAIATSPRVAFGTRPDPIPAWLVADSGSFERDIQNFGDLADETEIEIPPQMLGNLVHVRLVELRSDHARDPEALRRQGLLLQPADRQHLPGQRDFAGHRHVVAHRTSGQQ